MASVTAESDGACAAREDVIADGVKHGDRRLLIHHRPDDRKLNGLGWPRPWNALRGRPRGGYRARVWRQTRPGGASRLVVMAPTVIGRSICLPSS